MSGIFRLQSSDLKSSAQLKEPWVPRQRIKQVMPVFFEPAAKYMLEINKDSIKGLHRPLLKGALKIGLVSQTVSISPSIMVHFD